MGKTAYDGIIQVIFAIETERKPFLSSVFLCLILILGLYFRVHAVLNTVVDVPVRADARLYYLYSLNLQKSGTFSHSLPDAVAPVPDAFAPPVYPLFIAPFTSFPPPDTMSINIGLVQALLGTLTILFTYLLIKQVGGELAGLMAATLTAVSPHLISLTVYMLTETLFTFLMMGGLLCMAYAFQSKKPLSAVAAGLLLGIAALTRSTLEYFPIFVLLLVVVLIVYRRFERGQIRNVLIFFGSAVLVVGMWKIRNLMTLGVLSDPTLPIATLQHGMYPDFMFNALPESLGIPYKYDPRTSEISASVHSVLQEIYLRFRDSPWLYLKWYLIGKPIALLSWNLIDGWGDVFVYPVLDSPFFTSVIFKVTRMMMLGIHALLMACGTVCAAMILIRPSSMKLSGVSQTTGLFMSLLVIYFILLHMVGAPFSRYSIPLRPVLYGLAVIFLIALSQRGFKYAKIWQDRRKV